MKKFIPTISLLLLAAFAFSGCETSGQNALLGAATGAAVGGALHGRGDQALAGAAIGAAGGYLIGKAVQHDRRRVYSEGYYDGRDDRYDDDRRDDRSYREDRYQAEKKKKNPEQKKKRKPYAEFLINKK